MPHLRVWSRANSERFERRGRIASSMRSEIEGPRPLTPTLSHKGRGSSPPFGRALARPVAQLHDPTSQLPCIAERERGDATGVFVEDQGAGDWRFGPLAAIFALEEPAIYADRRALGLLEVHPGSVDQSRRMTNFTAEPDGETWLRQRVRRHRTAHHLRDREIPRAVGQFDYLLPQAVRCVEGGVHVPQRTGAAEFRKREGAGGKSLRNVAGVVDAQ